MKKFEDFLKSVNPDDLAEELTKNIGEPSIENLTIPEKEWKLLSHLIFSSTTVMLKRYHQWLHSEENL